MKHIAGLMFGLLLWPAAIGSYARAGVITWTFQGATFNDGGTLSGSFQFDGVSTYSNVNIITMAGTHTNGEGGPLAAFTFTNAGTYLGGDSRTSLEICVTTCDFNPGSQVLTLYFGTDTTGPGLNGPSPVPILAIIDSAQSQGANFRSVTAGSVTSAPEPSSVTLGVIGGLGICLLRLRSRRIEASKMRLET